MTPEQTQQLRSLPAVSELLESDAARHWCQTEARTDVADALRAALDCARDQIRDDAAEVTRFDTPEILRIAEQDLTRRTASSLKRVINATGVVLHTGLGRAPLARAAIDAIVQGASGYTNLEYDLERGTRGSRQSHVADLLCKLTGAEAATVVNNNAAATLFIMRAFCDGQHVIISRGQLIEIGGSFRIPDVLSAGGAILSEVGTTNRTRISDYAGAITASTAAILRVHLSNFRMVGFTEQAPPEDLVRCAHEHNLLAIDDLGSGALFDLSRFGIADEPFVAQSIDAGFDLVCFSGDKLLGGPQAGIIVGRKDLIDHLESHPLMRSLRLDKLVLLALEATLRQYADPARAIEQIPTLAMLSVGPDALADRAKALAKLLADALTGEEFTTGSDTSYAGGGTLPGEGLATVVVRWRPSEASPQAVLNQLRHAPIPVVARVADDHIVFDLRTLTDSDFNPLVAALASLR